MSDEVTHTDLKRETSARQADIKMLIGLVAAQSETLTAYEERIQSLEATARMLDNEADPNERIADLESTVMALCQRIADLMDVPLYRVLP